MAAQRFDPIQMELDSLESKLIAIKVLYDQYFIGIERKEPLRERAKIERAFRDFDSRMIQNTAARFRLQGLKSRWIALGYYWTRTQRQIEDGTYRGHQILARLHERDRMETRKAKEAVESPKKNTTKKSKSSKAKAKDPLEDLHRKYNQARKKTGESKVDSARLSEAVKKQAAAIKKKYKCRKVEFRVTIVDGKTKLKAIPKK